jgi:hypothetical protein
MTPYSFPPPPNLTAKTLCRHVQHLIAKPGWRNSQGIHKAYLFAVFTLLSTAAVAQLTLSGEIRPRVEYRDGFKLNYRIVRC